MFNKLFKRTTTTSPSPLDEYLFASSAKAPHPLLERDTLYRPKVDLHSHLIPGIDDGAESMDEAIELILRLKALGYTKLITTPHIASHRYLNTSQIILDGLKELRIELRVRNIDIEIEAASEYYLDEHFMQLLEQRDILTFGGSFVLFELSYVNHPLSLFEMIKRMQEAGYKPVLAHPERYLYMYKAFEKFEQLKTMGVCFQLNLNSLTGYYSAEVKAAAMALLDRGMIDFIGSDTHKARHVQTLSGVFDAPAYAHLCARNRLLNNLL
ncbi:MAG: capsular biosynthesis protein [Campylobacterales bacterium]|nr:capsular biosynthesis protein [Campylobacterales bacterium]